MIQLNFFDSLEDQLLAENRVLKNEMRAVQERSTKVATSTDKVRRALFARNGELQKRVDELELRLAILEKHICTSKVRHTNE